MHQEFRDKGLAVIAVDIQESQETVANWVRLHHTSFTVLMDSDGSVARRYGVTATPTVFVVGRDGTLLGKALGTKEWTSESGRALLRTLTAQ